MHSFKYYVLPLKYISMTSASCVLLYCRELGIEPTADTYTVLMCDFAEKGDITGIEKVGDKFFTYWYL